MNHLLQINADYYDLVDENIAATGNFLPVNGTPFDFRKATTIGARINDNSEQLKNGKGYNHNFILNKHSSRTPVARIKGEKSGIIMEVCTEERELHFSSCNPVTGTKNHDIHSSFSLTGQHFMADKPFRSDFDNAGSDMCKYTSVYRFKTG